MDPSSASCRIIVVSSSLDTSREVAHRIKALSGDSSDAQASSEVIHWTIKNKYYTAPVHFHPIHLEGLESIELDDVPAVIYAWKENEPYKTHVKQVSELTSTCEPEVSLAIGMAPSTEEELEDFFFEHGFEYIDGHSQVPDKSISLSDSTATPGFHRVLDALSTIMWPSMIRAEPTRLNLTSQRAALATGDGQDEADLGLQTLVNAAGGKSNIQREMEMLEKWLEEDDDAHRDGADDNNDNDYASLYSHAQSVLTVRSDDPWSTELGTPRASKDDVWGFDDDFTEFVSAPAAASQPARGDGDDDEEELPSEADILAASAHIFGASAPPDADCCVLDADAIDADSGADVPAFDLSRVLDALEGMKAEITHMPDVQERRRAAAKAALGVVYGLEMQ